MKLDPLPVFGFDPFAAAVKARARTATIQTPHCPTRPWWRKSGNRWWLLGTSITISFPGDTRILVWTGDVAEVDAKPGDGGARRQNRLLMAIAAVAVEVDPELPKVEATHEVSVVSELAEILSGPASPLRTARALELVDAALPPRDPPPLMPGQTWLVSFEGLVSAQISEVRLSGLVRLGSLGAFAPKLRPFPYDRALLLDGPFAPWAPAGFAMTEAAVRRSCLSH